MKKEKIHKIVREGYAKIAKTEQCGCGCGSGKSQQIGYNCQELSTVPEGADLGLGCGNPLAVALLREGEIVIDLGSGAGLDCFIAAKKVGETGKVIGVDMTLEMLEKARANLKKGGYRNVEFRLGEIENLPVADNTADVVISNCVINLSPDKQRVFNEAFRVLKPGGRIMISDIVLLNEIPEELKASVPAYIACVAGAELKTEYLRLIESAGFKDIKVVKETPFYTEQSFDFNRFFYEEMALDKKSVEALRRSIVSISIIAFKPRQ
ncbi:MAG: arsenite methyltransferase [Candidatus Bathyarchaeia archaeon]